MEYRNIPISIPIPKNRERENENKTKNRGLHKTIQKPKSILEELAEIQL